MKNIFLGKLRGNLPMKYFLSISVNVYWGIIMGKNKKEEEKNNMSLLQTVLPTK